MKISHGTRIEDISEMNGYGYATRNMIDSLTRLGHSVRPNDETADVEIWFDQPHHWDFSEGPYKIGYHPWESTMLKKGWPEIMNQCDEIWTPSPLIAEWYQKYAGITRPVYVYEHGVDPIWTPKHRAVTDKMRFLHVGGEASRKGLKEILTAFSAAFHKNKKDVELTLKVASDGWNIAWWSNVNVINKKLPLPALIELYHSHHVYAYPSYGEGFGLTPLQAMATGMPTITVPQWAPYNRFLDPNLSIDSKFVRSPWPRLHPGAMLKPDIDDLVDTLRYVFDHYDDAQAFAHAQIPALTDYYDWDKLTKSAFENLAERLSKFPQNTGFRTSQMV